MPEPPVKPSTKVDELARQLANIDANGAEGSPKLVAQKGFLDQLAELAREGVHLEPAAGQESLVNLVRKLPQKPDAETSDFSFSSFSEPLSEPLPEPVDEPIDSLIGKLCSRRMLSPDQVEWAREHLKRSEDNCDLASAITASGLLKKEQVTSFIESGANEFAFGEYLITEKIGAGGMGVILKARQLRLERVVAIKVLSKRLLGSNNAVNRFFQELRAAARLSHPNVVRAYDAGEFNGTHYLVMEHVDGVDLSNICARCKQLPVAHAVNVIVQAARGLSYAHQMGIVHRDVKPANLLVDSHGKVKVLDMGLARIGESESEDGLTKSGQIMGTIDYMAPEQAINTRLADARSDVYSLGCALFRLLTGRRMYDRGSTVNKLLAHAKEEIPSLTSLHPDLPKALDDVFRQMVAKNPQDRLQSMDEVVAALAPIKESTRANENLAEFVTSVREGRHLPSSEAETRDTLSATFDLPDNGLNKVDQGFAVSIRMVVAALILAAVCAVGFLDWPEQPGSPNVKRVPTNNLSVEATDDIMGDSDLGLFFAGAKFEVDTAGIKIGSDLKSDLLLVHDGMASQNHARVFRKAEGVFVEDLGSDEGTWVNGLRVTTSRLEHGDIVRCGLSHVYVSAGQALEPWGNSWPDEGFLVLTRSVNLLPLIDFDKDSVLGKWERFGTNVLSDEMPYSRIQVPVVPQGSYRLTCKFKRHTGIEAIAFTLPVGNTQCRIVLNGWSEDHSGIDSIDGDNPPYGNPTHFRFRCQQDVWHQLSAIVAVNGETCAVTAAIDGAEVINWSGDQSRLSVVETEEIPNGSTFGLGSYESQYEFSELKLEMIDGFAYALRESNRPAMAIAPFDEAQAKKHQDEWAKYLRLPHFVAGSDDIHFALIPPGEFGMGWSETQHQGRLARLNPDLRKSLATALDAQGPQRRVTISKPFYIGMHEITQGQYRRVMGDNPSRFVTAHDANTSDDTNTDLLPVDSVSWNDAIMFCNRLSERDGFPACYTEENNAWITDFSSDGYRLPTEAEWEYCCRAGTDTTFYFGEPVDWDSRKDPAYANFWTKFNNQMRSKPVGTSRPNAFRLFDMHGNISELCNDLYRTSEYRHLRAVDPIGPTRFQQQARFKGTKVVRGGCWHDDPRAATSTVRREISAKAASPNVGFRVVRGPTLSPTVMKKLGLRKKQ